MRELVTQVSLFMFSQQKTWDAMCGEEWIYAKLWNEVNINACHVTFLLFL